MPRATDRLLFQQRLFLAGLALIVLCTAGLLWHLRSSEPRALRGDGVAAADPRSAPERSPDRPETRASAPEEAREAFVAPALSPPTAPVEGFEPDALYGLTRVAGAPEPDVELWVFAEDLAQREVRAPLLQGRSDEHGRFRLRGLVPHRRYTVLAQSARVLPQQAVLFPGAPEELELTRAVTVAGHVRARADGRALEGVEIALQRQHWDGNGLADRVTARSSADGSFTLPWVEAGMQSFLVTRAGRLAERREFQVRPEVGLDFEILLDDVARLELLVVDLATGAPLSDTELSSPDGPVRTDARGVLALPFASDGTREEQVRIVLSYPLDVLTEGRLKVGPPGGPLPRVPVARGARVTGRVLDAGGAPVPDATVRLIGGARTPLPLGLPEGFWLGAPRGTVRSGPDGRFTLAGCVPRNGTLEVLARHPLHADGRSQPFPLDRLGQEQEVEVRMAAGGAIAGLVTRDGEPLAYTVQWENDDHSGWVRSNERGEYRIDGLADGTTFLRPRAEGDWDDEPRPADREVQVVAGTTVTCDLALVTDGATIEGRVLDADGQPVAEVELMAYSESEEDGDELSSNSTTSAHDGSFTLTLPPVSGRLFTVWAEKGPRTLERTDVAPGTRGLELVLPNLGRVALRVRDALARAPVQGFRLYWRTSDEGHFQRLAQDSDRFSAGPDGFFHAELPEGRLDLVVAARHLGYLPAWQSGVTVDGGERELDFELELGVELELAFTGEAGLWNQLRRAFCVTREQRALATRGGDFYGSEIRGAQGLRPDERGIVRLRGAAPGLYEFERVPEGLRIVPAGFELPSVLQHRQELRLEPKEPKPGRAGG